MVRTTCTLYSKGGRAGQERRVGTAGSSVEAAYLDSISG